MELRGYLAFMGMYFLVILYRRSVLVRSESSVDRYMTVTWSLNGRYMAVMWPLHDRYMVGRLLPARRAGQRLRRGGVRRLQREGV